jgi:succinate dehydrogenase/fumarate reductase flavoprotein subunit
MQNDAAVFRTGETLEEGCQKIDETVASFSEVKVSHGCGTLPGPFFAHMF